MILTAFKRSRGLGHRVTTPDFANVAFTFGPDSGVYALLFAAAPEILEALRKAEVFVKAEWDHRESSFLPEPTSDEETCLNDAYLTHAAIVAAIAKAEGRS